MSVDRTGSVPAGYELVRELGSGRTAHVFLARHPERGEVALKLPREELEREPLLRRMFENEVQITLGLRHPHLVAALDGAPTGKGAFLALEYCSGDTLAARLRGAGRLPLFEARRLIVEVARGLEHAHGRLVLHRDVKPANVFLDSRGRAKLGDFGTGAHLTAGKGVARAGTEAAGQRVGTAYYMAPEIFEGEPASVRSDVYSLGILAYEVLAGTRPFDGDSYEDLMVAHLSGLPRALTHHRPELSRSEVKVVGTAMARNAGQRFATVHDFREAFAEATGMTEEQSPVDSEPLTGRASRKRQAGSSVKSDERKGSEDDLSSRERSGQGQGGLLGWFRKKRDE